MSIVVSTFKNGDYVNEEFEEKSRVRFPVQPPIVRLAADQGGGSVRLQAKEGWIEVRVTKDGAINVSGAHSLTIEPRAANDVMIRLLSDETRP